MVSSNLNMILLTTYPTYSTLTQVFYYYLELGKFIFYFFLLVSSSTKLRPPSLLSGLTENESTAEFPNASLQKNVETVFLTLLMESFFFICIYLFLFILFLFCHV